MYNIKSIIAAVSVASGISIKAISGKSRKINNVMARRAIAHLALQNGYRHETIALKINRNRTVIYHYQRTNDGYLTDKLYREILEESINILNK